MVTHILANISAISGKVNCALSVALTEKRLSFTKFGLTVFCIILQIMHFSYRSYFCREEQNIWELIKLLHCAGYLCDITHHACVFGWMQSRFKFSPLHLSCSLCFSCTCFCGELLLIISSSSFPPCILGFSSHFSSSSLAPYPSPTFLPSTSLPPIHLIYPLLFFPWTTWPGSLP